MNTTPAQIRPTLAVILERVLKLQSLDTLQYDRVVWDDYIEQQKVLCKELGVRWTETEPNQIIGLSVDTSHQPIHGLRHPIENNSGGWYVWTGEYSEDEDFYKPIHVGHLVDIKPELLKYLGLPPRYRFLVDKAGYEDIWLTRPYLKFKRFQL